VQALDARGNVVPGVTIRFTAHGGRFQGSVDSSGVVRGGAPGTVPIAIVATTLNGRPHAEKIAVRILPDPRRASRCPLWRPGCSRDSDCTSTPLC
jgi:hypothetical protein